MTSAALVRIAEQREIAFRRSSGISIFGRDIGQEKSAYFPTVRWAVTSQLSFRLLLFAKVQDGLHSSLRVSLCIDHI